MQRDNYDYTYYVYDEHFDLRSSARLYSNCFSVSEYLE